MKNMRLTNRKCKRQMHNNSAMKYYAITNLRCLRNEKKRLFTKMVLYSHKDIDLLRLSLPRINEYDHFFKESENGNGSCFSSDDYDNNISMTRGYASAALFFLKVINESDSKYLRACYISPCLFCFRHYVELTLKDTLWHYSRLGYEIDVTALNEEHNLASLWGKLLSLIDRKSNDFRNIGRLIHELSDIDKSGTIFRYSYYFSKRNRIPSKSLNMMIDNKHLYRIMTQMFRFLEGLNDDIRNALDEFNSYNVNF